VVSEIRATAAASGTCTSRKAASRVVSVSKRRTGGRWKVDMIDAPCTGWRNLLSRGGVLWATTPRRPGSRCAMQQTVPDGYRATSHQAAPRHHAPTETAPATLDSVRRDTNPTLVGSCQVWDITTAARGACCSLSCPPYAGEENTCTEPCTRCRRGPVEAWSGGVDSAAWSGSVQ